MVKRPPRPMPQIAGTIRAFPAINHIRAIAPFNIIIPIIAYQRIIQIRAAQIFDIHQNIALCLNPPASIGKALIKLDSKIRIQGVFTG